MERPDFQNVVRSLTATGCAVYEQHAIVSAHGPAYIEMCQTVPKLNALFTNGINARINDEMPTLSRIIFTIYPENK